MSFENLNLNASLLRAVQTCGFTTPTDIQAQAIPPAMEGRDVMASAQTGSGKTAAFVLAALERLIARPAAHRKPGPRVLILTPTRELSLQICEQIRLLTRFTRTIYGNAVGGTPYSPQIRMLRKPLDILVGTPGRLIDHLERGTLDLSQVETFVLDEADRMLDMGFVDAVTRIASAVSENRQTMLFSATLEGRIATIAGEILKDPVRIKLTANRDVHASIEQKAIRARNFSHKQSLLSQILTEEALGQTIIFTATKRGAEELAETLSTQGHASEALHGDMSQGMRTRTMERMRRKKFRLLVATDVAARGLDIEGISHVINFDLPMVPEDYIHRIGRTGRAGTTGTAISFVGPEDRRKLAGIERLTGRRLLSDSAGRSEAFPSGPRQRRPRPSGPQAGRPPRREDRHTGAAQTRTSRPENGRSPFFRSFVEKSADATVTDRRQRRDDRQPAAFKEWKPERREWTPAERETSPRRPDSEGFSSDQVRRRPKADRVNDAMPSSRREKSFSRPGSPRHDGRTDSWDRTTAGPKNTNSRPDRRSAEPMERGKRRKIYPSSF